MSQFPQSDEFKVQSSKSSGESAAGDRTGDPLNIIPSAASGPSYWITPAISNAIMAVTSTGPAHMVMSLNFVNSTWHEYAHGALKAIYYHKLITMLRILGLMTVISYMTVILFTWIYANLMGYVYFSAGEPVLMIKYPEWILGFIGIFVAVDLLRKELDRELYRKADFKKAI